MVHRVSDKFREEVMDMHRQLNAIEIITRPGIIFLLFNIILFI